ncbi:hypothetical protein [Mesorhizobium sp. CAU 1741]|uniref:hypothetical protein n=1 Tax=Mesorhizobium sp. CAU 1741 TaxID=3140366 RepID=UPI00325AB295
MNVFARLVDATRRYADHPDPRVAAANFTALLVASNQPFYPLYIYWLVGERIEPSLYTFFSTPFFLAVPALARVNSVAGRALLPLAGIGNAIMCANLFGVRSGVEIFLIPCAVLALALFRPGERIVGFALAGITLLAFLWVPRFYGVPLVAYSEQEYTALVRLNAVSAAMLTAFVALMMSNMLAAAESSAETIRGEKAR